MYAYCARYRSVEDGNGDEVRVEITVETPSERVRPIGADDRRITLLDAIMAEGLELVDLEAGVADFEAILRSNLLFGSGTDRRGELGKSESHTWSISGGQNW